jgi:hypothetical protein
MPETGEVSFDEQLAEQLGADQYGMRTYVMALLKAGPDRSHDEETAGWKNRLNPGTSGQASGVITFLTLFSQGRIWSLK